MVSALKLTAESIWRGPQSVRFHFQGEIALGTVEHQNNGLRAAFLHCNLFLCVETGWRDQGKSSDKKNTYRTDIEVSRKYQITS